jgi:hypothetical protein
MTALGSADFEAARHEGAGLSVAEALELVTTLPVLAAEVRHTDR